MLRSKERSRLRPDDRRAAILAAARGLITERGFRGITLQQVADACGMSKAGLLHHFPSKEAVLVGVLEQRDHDDTAALEPIFAGSVDKETLRAALAALVYRNVDQPGLIRLYAVLGAEALDPEHPAHSYFIRRRNDARHTLAELARPWHADPDAFAIRVLAFMDGLQLGWLSDPSIDVRDEWARYAEWIFSESVSVDG